MTLELSFCFIITGNKSDVVNNPACNGQYTFIQFIASAVCHRNPLTTGRYLGIKTTKRQVLTLCEVEVYSRGNGLIIYCIALKQLPVGFGSIRSEILEKFPAPGDNLTHDPPSSSSDALITDLLKTLWRMGSVTYRLLAAVMVSLGDINAIERKGNRGNLFEGYFELLVRLGVAWCKVTQDSLGFWILCCGFRIPWHLGTF